MQNINELLLNQTKQNLEKGNLKRVFENLNTLIGSKLSSEEMKQWIQLFCIMVEYPNYSEEETRWNTAEIVYPYKARKLLMNALINQIFLLNAFEQYEIFIELSISFLVQGNTDESAAYLGKALKCGNISQFDLCYIWMLKCPTVNFWSEDTLKYFLSLLDHLTIKPKLAKCLYQIHFVTIQTSLKKLKAKLNYTQGNDKYVFSNLLPTTIFIIERLLSHASFDEASDLLSFLENVLDLHSDLKNQWNDSVKHFRFAINENKQIAIQPETIQVSNTLQEEQQLLSKARNYFKQSIEKINEKTVFAEFINTLNAYQKDFFKSIDLIVKNLSTQLDFIYGPTPCHWALIVGGSHGRGDMKLDSDLESALLIEKIEFRSHPYFKAVLSMLQKCFLILGEEWDYDESNLKFYFKQLHIDRGNLDNLDALIQTPKNLAQWIFNILSSLDNDNVKPNLEKQILAFGLCYAQLAYVSHPNFQALTIFQQEFTYQVNIQKNSWKAIQRNTIELFRNNSTRKLDYKIALHAISKIVFSTQSFETFNYHQQLENITFFEPHFKQHLIQCWMQLIKQRILKQSDILEWIKQTLFIPFYCIDNLLEIVPPFYPWKTYLARHPSLQGVHKPDNRLQATLLEVKLSESKVKKIDQPIVYRSEIQKNPLLVLILTMRYGQLFNFAANQIQPVWDETIQLLLQNLPAQWTPNTYKTWTYLDKHCTVAELLSALIFHGANSDELIHTSDSNNHIQYTLLDLTLQKKQLGWLLCLLNCGAGKRTQFPISHYINYFNEATTIWQPLIKFTIQNWKQQNSEVEWYLTKQDLFEPLPQILTQEQINRLMEGIDSQKVLLKKAIYDQLLQSKFKQNEYGRSHVIKIILDHQTFFFKFFPEAPGIEDAVQKLARSYFPNTILCSELFLHNHTLLLISRGVEGYNLQDVLNALSSCQEVVKKAFQNGITPEIAKECMANIDHYSFSQHVLLTIFTNDEDGKPDNKFLVPFKQVKKILYRIVSIDNDHAFFDSTYLDPEGHRQLQLKSILFCLDQMQSPLHPQAVSEFLKVNGIEAIETWLQILQKRQLRYEAIQARLSIKDPSWILDIIFPQGSISKLWEKWEKTNIVLKENPQILAIELLRRVMPLVGLRYSNAFKEQTPTARFNQISQKSYTSILLKDTAIQYITKNQTRQLLNQGVAKGAFHLNKFGPKEAFDEIQYTKKEHSQLSHILEQLKEGNFEYEENGVKKGFKHLYLDSNKAEIINQLDWQLLKNEQKNALLALVRESGLNTQYLKLKNCSTLSSASLGSLLKSMPGLQHLILEQTPVTDKLWKQLEELCPTLEILTLVDVPSLASTRESSFWQEELLPHFPELAELKIEQAPNFTTLKIIAPKLKKLVVEHTQIAIIQTRSLVLENLTVSNNPKLDLDGLAKGFELLGPFKIAILPPHWQTNSNWNYYVNHPCLLARESFSWVNYFRADLKRLLERSVTNTKQQLQLKRLINIHIQQLKLIQQILPRLLQGDQFTLYNFFKVLYKLELTLENYNKDYLNNLKRMCQKLLDSNDKGVQYYAALLLLVLDKENKTVDHIIVPLFQSTDSMLLQDLSKTLIQTKKAEHFLNSYIQLLENQNSSIQDVAIRTISQMIIHAPSDEIVNEFFQKLMSRKEYAYFSIRNAIIKIFVQAGQRKESMIKKLLEALAYPHSNFPWYICEDAINAVGLLKLNGEDIINKLRRIVSEPSLDYRIRTTAIKTLLQELDASVDSMNELLIVLNDKSWGIREAAINTLNPQTISLNEELLRKLIDLIHHDDDFHVRIAVIEKFKYIGKLTKEMMDAFLYALKKEQVWEVRKVAAQAIEILGDPNDRHITEVLIHTLQNETQIEVIESIVRALIKISLDEKYYQSKMFKILERQIGTEKLFAELSFKEFLNNMFTQMLNQTKVFFEIFGNELKNNKNLSLENFENAIKDALEQTLKQCEEPRLPILIVFAKKYPAIINLIIDFLKNNSSESLSSEELQLLYQINSEEIFNLLFYQMKNFNVLASIGKINSRLIDKLINILSNPEKDFKERENAAEVLGNINIIRSNVLQPFINIVQDESIDYRIRTTTIKAFENLMKLAKDTTNFTEFTENALHAFLQALNSESWGIREAAARALGTFIHLIDLEISSHYKVDKNIQTAFLEAKLPNSDMVEAWEEHEVKPDGDCDFTTLGTDRKTLSNKLLSLKDNEEHRKFLSEEIKNTFVTYMVTSGEEGLNPPLFNEWNGLYQKQKYAQNCLDELFRKIRDELAHNAAQQLELNLLIDWLAKNGKLNLSQALQKQQQAVFDAEAELQNYCEKATVFEYYVKALGNISAERRLWLGYKSALLYARQVNCALYIWKKDSNISNQLILIDYNQGSGTFSSTIHMLHTHGFTHFNLLSKMPIEKTEKLLICRKDQKNAIIKILIDKLSDNHEFVQLASAQSLIKNSNIKTSTPTLIQFLKNSVYSSLKASVIEECFEYFTNIEPEVTNALTIVLQNDYSWDLKLIVAKIFIKHDKKINEVIDALIQLLKDEKSKSNYKKAIEAFEKFTNLNPKIVDAIKDVLLCQVQDSWKDWENKLAAAQILVQHNQKIEEVTNTLNQCLKDPNLSFSYHKLAIEILGKFKNINKIHVAILIDAFNLRNQEGSISDALIQLAKINQNMISEALLKTLCDPNKSNSQENVRSVLQKLYKLNNQVFFERLNSTDPNTVKAILQILFNQAESLEDEYQHIQSQFENMIIEKNQVGNNLNFFSANQAIKDSKKEVVSYLL